MGSGRAERFKIRSGDAKETKAENKIVKTKERVRRSARMLAKIKASKPPYTSAVLSWLSRELDKPSTKITATDVQAVLKGK